MLAAKTASAQALRLYPNPARTTVWLERPASNSSATVELFDAVGKCQWRGEWRGTQLAIPVQQLPAGLYLVRVLTANEMPFVERVMVEH
ncbi:T9SS type A sorting domain-containing protein [Hymenobacter sp.]|uniref:T9SS type A sorting domain-containing protein n=1 Tax=Hymenobacter sp. TaxID=1898978 RepID=UPI00286A25EB|nr:T9SS type A sorting domain-containing protein [Hymenobacter sp.]